MIGPQAQFVQLSQHFGPVLPQGVSSEEIGQKSRGLLKCASNFTPPFFIIKAAFFRKWLSEKVATEQFLNKVLNQTLTFFKKREISKFIVRSSAKIETLNERGHYTSSPGGITQSQLLNTVRDVWEKNQSNLDEFQNNEFAVIIQEYIKPKLSGHLSNERRVSRNINNWLIEIVDEKEIFQSSKRFTVNRRKQGRTQPNLNCGNKGGLIEVLRNLSSYYLSTQSKRFHIEWVWDGAKVWIVQSDTESSVEVGSPPGSDWKITKQITGSKQLSCFQTVSTTNNNWKKIKCVKTFIDCELPFGEVYILENKKIIHQIKQGKINEQLINDIEWLLHYPILIRMDILNSDGINSVLLPRTETIFTAEKAFDFLIKRTLDFCNANNESIDFCFLIHRFIISRACALAFSKPNIPKARIDSTWGIVDGLYYHPHDSFEVNLKDDTIKKQIRCKTEYLDVDNTGKWFSKRSGTNWDWSESLNKDQLKEIALYNSKIADFLNSPVTVMYFVDIDKGTGYPSTLPWYYTIEEILESSVRFNKVIFSERSEIIQNEADFERLKEKIGEIVKSKISIKLKFNPDILREKKLVEEIGDFAKDKSILVEIEGSILSHPYYILRKRGARVKCVDPFEPKYKIQKFYKLVRDKIPVNIESKGERVKTLKIDPSQLLGFLKRKVIEESFEFFWENEEGKIIEELADIYEILKSVCRIYGIEINEIDRIAAEKTEKKGGFESGVFLLETSDAALIDVIDAKRDGLLEGQNPIDRSSFSHLQKIKPIHVQNDSVEIPYFLNTEGSQNQIKIPIDLPGNNTLEITYIKSGIRLKFIRGKDSKMPGQLELF